MFYGFGTSAKNTSMILIINAGSSSIKSSLFEIRAEGPVLQVHGQIEGIGTPHVHAAAKDAAGQPILEEKWSNGGGPRDHTEALNFLVGKMTAELRGEARQPSGGSSSGSWKPAGVGHRVVHGGMRYHRPVVIDAQVRAELESLIPLAPLHQPANLEGIDAAKAAFPGVPQVACFDTAFHHGRPFVAQAFAIPRAFYDNGVRRYGFHGLSYEFITLAMRELAPAVARGRMIICHLGNGVSLCAVRDGRCVDTTMAFTAVEGLPMGTRSGQLDPGVILYLLEEKKFTPAQVSDLIYKQSGLLGLSGVSSDMRDLLAATDSFSKEAVDYFVYRVTWYVGALIAIMGGVDGIVFTAGIGEHAAPIRERVCRNLGWCGLELDPAANNANKTCISTPSSKVSAWVVPTDEERMIAKHVIDLLKL
jgi:acetate kinase